MTNDDRDGSRSPILLSPLRWLWNRRNVWERLTIALLALRITNKARRLRQMRQQIGGKIKWTMDVDAFLELNPTVLHDDAVWPLSSARDLEMRLNNLLRSAP